MKTVFYFTADWAELFFLQKQIVEDLKKEGFQFQKVDADYEQLLVKRFEVKSVPTFILFENKKEIKRITGAQTKEDLIKFINYEKNT